MSKRLGVSEEKATRQLEALYSERNAFVREHFLKDPTDLRQYDLILDAWRFGIADCVQSLFRP